LWKRKGGNTEDEERLGSLRAYGKELDQPILAGWVLGVVKDLSRGVIQRRWEKERFMGDYLF